MDLKDLPGRIIAFDQNTKSVLNDISAIELTTEQIIDCTLVLLDLVECFDRLVVVSPCSFRDFHYVDISNKTRDVITSINYKYTIVINDIQIGTPIKEVAKRLKTLHCRAKSARK